MIVDSSAIIAILESEPEADALQQALDRSPGRTISAVNYVETGILIDGRGDPVLSRTFDNFLFETRIRIESVTPEQARLAREAYRDFGKGRHRAGLNLGDCFSYALAKCKREPLLFKGNDFRKTDVEVAEY
jgi:ribonuclease VapC